MLRPQEDTLPHGVLPHLHCLARYPEHYVQIYVLEPRLLGSLKGIEGVIFTVYSPQHVQNLIIEGLDSDTEAVDAFSQISFHLFIAESVAGLASMVISASCVDIEIVPQTSPRSGPCPTPTAATACRRLCTRCPPPGIASRSDLISDLPHQRLRAYSDKTLLLAAPERQEVAVSALPRAKRYMKI